MGLFNKDKSDENVENKVQGKEVKTSSTTSTANPSAPSSSIMSSASLRKQEAINNPQSASANLNIPRHVNDVPFSDVYITPDKKCYIRSGLSASGLKVANFIDMSDFIKNVIEKYDGKVSSYSVNYKGRNYRVERTIALEGEQYCARKLPAKIPDLEKLGLPVGIYKALVSLAGKSGLILLTGATGSGKSTTISALIKKYLQNEGGYAFTIEDPIEFPLDGVYETKRGDLGLCKQTLPPDGRWDEGIKSALRSKPRYIYLGEIRSPEAAVELLRAATSGHLVVSTIHGNNVSDALVALGKYAASSGITEDLANEMMANGILACVHQTLVGKVQHLKVEAVFANPDRGTGCQVRSMIRGGKLNLATIIEQQKNRMDLDKPLFDI